MFQISGIIVDKSERDYSGNLENARNLKTKRIFNNFSHDLQVLHFMMERGPLLDAENYTGKKRGRAQ